MLTHKPLHALLALLIGAASALAAPLVRDADDVTTIETPTYRLTCQRETADLMLELKSADGQWHPIAKTPGAISFGYLPGPDAFLANGLRTTWATVQTPDAVVVGWQAMLDPMTGLLLEVHYICAGEGVLIASRLSARQPDGGQGSLWSPPRILLEPAGWDEYAFWAADGRRHAGRIADLQPLPAYAGVSPWGEQGDTVARLDPQHPALIVRSSARGVGLGVVLIGYADRWAGSYSFLQQHTPNALYLYGGYSPAPRDNVRWAWLAPFAAADPQAEARLVENLLQRGEAMALAFRPISPPVPDDWLQPLPDFPAALRRPQPVRDINAAVVFTINEPTASDYAVSLARKAGSDCLIRGWFKWAQAPPVAEWRRIPQQIHQLGALFGGGITCSALYEGENGLTQQQVLNLATRGPAGQLIDAWDQPGVRHGSLSSPAYLDYLFRWCREQLDAGADYLFMDEHTAALSGLEGYDDHSLADFLRYLLAECPQTRDWPPDDPRWRTDLKVPLDNPQVCPTGGMDSFDYRAYLRLQGLLDNPASPQNPLYMLWGQFRSYRDDRAWRTLTDRIRAYAKQQNRTVLISANGIARYVDLQVLGVWGQWRTQDGHIDLRENQLPYWRTLVQRGHDVAEKQVPVVLFHDWGFGDPPFPWLAVRPSEREVWMRTRGAEVYAAGGFFAFPVLGPFGCDAAKDGTLRTIAKQAAFYQANRDLYLRGRFLGCETLRTDADLLSLSAWWHPDRHAVLLHVINRNVQDGRLLARRNVAIELPVSPLPETAAVISPDWDGERTATCRATANGIEVTLADLDAYAVAILRYAEPPDLSRLADPARIRPSQDWMRPARSEFAVRPDGSVEHATDLPGFLQGMLHSHLRNPPTFLVNAAGQVQLLVHVRAVAAAGARLEYRVDGETQQTVDLPDLDRQNDGAAAEYDRTLSFPIPPGRHRLTLDNVGPDWLTVSWYEFQGTFTE